jgi:raffinose/stachyose/melibiose transport system permease protein
MKAKRRLSQSVLFTILVLLSIAFIAPVLTVFMNSFKGRFFISNKPFDFPNSQTFVGLKNYTTGLEKIGFIQALWCSLFITIGSVLVIVLFTSMTAWYITRIKSKYTALIYYLLVFSMIVPFQMVMYTMSKMANILKLDSPGGLLVIYLGFGAGLSTFMFSGFIKGIPLEIEEAATIDGCNPIQTFFLVVFPILKPVAITVAILNTMWIWNDYLLPLLVLGNKYRTIPMAIQYLQGGYGSRDMGAMMAMLILSILPAIIFYIACQKYIVKGVVAGAVKG